LSLLADWADALWRVRVLAIGMTGRRWFMKGGVRLGRVMTVRRRRRIIGRILIGIIGRRLRRRIGGRVLIKTIGRRRRPTGGGIMSMTMTMISIRITEGGALDGLGLGGVLGWVVKIQRKGQRRKGTQRVGSPGAFAGGGFGGALGAF
jgi:hypothetical protein